jgi:hypothetical protein
MAVRRRKALHWVRFAASSAKARVRAIGVLAGSKVARRVRAQKSGPSAFGISETDASNAMLFSAQTASSIAPARVR